MQGLNNMKITDEPFIDHWEDGESVYHKGITKELVIQILDNQEKAEKWDMQIQFWMNEGLTKRNTRR